MYIYTRKVHSTHCRMARLNPSPQHSLCPMSIVMALSHIFFHPFFGVEIPT